MTTDLASLLEGKHDIDGDNAFAILNEYTTKPVSDITPPQHSTDTRLMPQGQKSQKLL